MRVMFNCGGTGGHIYPAIALYHTFREHHQNFEYLFVGSTHGLEGEIFKEEGISNVAFLSSRGIKRSLSLSNICSLFLNFISLWKAKKIMKQYKPDFLISTGGYPSFHMTYLASRMNIPFFLIESNAVSGLVTRLFYKKARRIFTSSSILNEALKGADRMRAYGVPIRKRGQGKTKEEIARERGLNLGEKIVLVVGGSCGAERINEIMIDLIKSNSLPVQFLFATGKKHYKEICEKIGVVPRGIQIVDYINNMTEVVSIVDMIVSRSGAMTISEIKQFEIPALLIPFAKATGNHQYWNAMELTEQGVAEIIREEDLSRNNLEEMIEKILLNKINYQRMKQNFGKIENKNPNQQIYEEIMGAL